MRTCKLYSHIFGIMIVASAVVPTFALAGAHSGIRRIYSGPASSETCVLMADLRAYCWGDTPGASSLLQIGKDLKSFAVGAGFRCALLHNETVECWGLNEFGQLGDGTVGATATERNDPKPVVRGGFNFDDVTSLTAGIGHVCAIRSGAAWCWGRNLLSEIGNYTLARTDDAVTPMPVVVHDSITNPQLAGLTRISAGKFHTCALLVDNTGACWGDDTFGQLGNNHNFADFNSPQTVYVESGGLQALVMGGGYISAGGTTTCGLVSDKVANSVACWGYNFEGQLGTGDHTSSSTALPATDEVGKIVDAVDVAESYASTCAILVDSTIRCWGSDDRFELGIGAGGSDQSRGTVLLASRTGAAFSGALQIVAGAYHFCARTLNDEVYCWGDNIYGQIGSAVGSHTATPIAVQIDAPLFTDNFETADYDTP